MEMVILIIFCSVASFIFGAFYGKSKTTEMAQKAMLDYMMYLKSKIGDDQYNDINVGYIKSIGLQAELKKWHTAIF